MEHAIDNIYKSLARPKDDATFFEALGKECRGIGRESKNENLTETAFYQVESTLEALYRDKKISLSTYHSITSVYYEWSHFRLDIGNINGWKEISNKGLNQTIKHLEESEEWKYSYLSLLYDIFEHTSNIEERWQLLSSSFLPYESIGKFSECRKSLCRGILLMETAFLMEKRGIGSDVKSNISLVLKAAEALRYCHDHHVSPDAPSSITASLAIKTLSDYYYKNQARYHWFDESMATRIEALLKLELKPSSKPSPSSPKGAKDTHAGVFSAIIAVILIACLFMIFRNLFSDNKEENVVKEQTEYIQDVQEESEAEGRQSKRSTVENGSISLPAELTGLYFVPKADGIFSKGITARISETENGKYDMAVYSDMPIKHYSLTLDRGNALFHSEQLGNGHISYDAQTRTTTINFSDEWILTN
jgi:hypothetical protein